MRKAYTHFEQVPVEVAERVLERENLMAERNGNRELVVKKSGRTSIRPNTLAKKPRVTTS